MGSKVFRDTAFGEAVYPHVNKADAKFNPDNPLFKTDLKLSGEDAQKEKARIDIDAQAAFDDYFLNGEGKELTAGEKKKFSVYYPYTIVEDEDGNPTGEILFHFKQNALIKIRDTGEVKKIVIGIYDAKGNASTRQVWGGSEIRVNYSARPIPMKSQKKIGVRLDFGRIQYRKLADTNAGAGGFGEVEGDYEEDEGGFGDSSKGTSGSGGGEEKADY